MNGRFATSSDHSPSTLDNTISTSFPVVNITEEGDKIFATFLAVGDDNGVDLLESLLLSYRYWLVKERSSIVGVHESTRRCSI